MNDELDQVAVGGRTIGRFGQFLPCIRFQADPGLGAGGGGEVAAPAAPADAGVDTGALADGQGAGATTDAAAPPPVAGGLDLSDPAVFERLAEHPRFGEILDGRAATLAGAIVEDRLAGLERFLQDQFAPGAGGPAAVDPGQGALELNPWDPGFGSSLAQMLQHEREQTLGEIRNLVAAVAAPMAAREEQEQVAEGNQRLQDIIADDIARNGDFPRAPGQTESQAQQAVMPFARMLFPQIAEQFGGRPNPQTGEWTFPAGLGPRAAETAMSRAAAYVRQIGAEAVAAAGNAEQNRLQALAGAGSGEPGAAAVAVQTAGPVKAATMEEGLSQVTSRHAGLLRASR